MFAGQVQLDEHVLIVHNNNNRERTNDRSDEFSKICCENQDLNNENLPEELSDVSDNNEEEKLESDDKSSGMGLLQDDRTVPEDLTMAVDPELADEVENTDVMGNLIEQHKEGDYESRELVDDSKEVEDTDAMGNLIQQHKEDRYEYEELPDDSTEVEDTDAIGNLIEQHKEDDYECKELPDDSTEVQDTDSMGNSIKQHKEDEYECRELADGSQGVEDADATENLIEQHKDDDELKSGRNRVVKLYGRSIPIY